MEIVCKDLCARITKFKTKSGVIETPTLFPVVSPTKQTVSSKQLVKAGAQGLITNSYLIRKEFPRTKDVHSFLKFKGPVMTDSGAFQLMQYGDIGLDNKTILEFQKKIKVDIGVPLDLPGRGTEKQIKDNLEESYKRSVQAKEIVGDSFILAGPIQGAGFPKLRKRSATLMRDLELEYYALGTVVPSLNEYDFTSHLIDLSITKQTLPTNTVLHDFGLGHPMFFAFAVAFGADVFDSAAYALFAKRGNYMTTSGTKKLGDLQYLPCSCPVCSEKQPEEFSEQDLALHNLYISFQEIQNIKQAIKENTLWELLEERAKAHPLMFKAFVSIAKHKKYLESLDPGSKPHFFYLSKQTLNRPEFLRHSSAMRGFSKVKAIDAFPFKNVPVGVLGMYPFGQRVLSTKKEYHPKINDLDEINQLAEYQFGVKKLFPKTVRVERSRKTHRIRSIYKGDILLATLRPSDYFIVPHTIAETIHKKTQNKQVVVSKDAVPFVKNGKNLFAKFVENCDPNIRAGHEVLMVDTNNNLLRTGKAVLSAREMKEFSRGMAVSTR